MSDTPNIALALSGESQARITDAVATTMAAITETIPAPSFIEQLAQWDEEMTADLVAVGALPVVPMPPNALGRASLETICNAVLERACTADAEIAASKAAEEYDIQLVRLAHQRRRAGAERRRAEALRFATELAQSMEYGKRQSITLQFGTVGYKRSKGGVVITDEQAAKAWALDNLRGEVVATIKIPLEVAEVLHKNATISDEVFNAAKRDIGVTPIKEHVARTGEDVPGTAHAEPSVQYYAKPENLFTTPE